MITPRQVSADKLIPKLVEELKKTETIQPHPSALLVKSGACSERPPQNHDFWYFRTAAILRKIYLCGPVGTQRLRTAYGKRKRRGHKPAHHRKAGGKFIRLMLQQLEKSELIQKTETPKRGRIITKKTQKLLDNLCKDLE